MNTTMTAPTHNAERFRERYRAGISRWYNAFVHGGFVLLYGIGVLIWLLSGIEFLAPTDWLVIPVGLVVFNIGEYTVHRGFGHHKQKIGGLFYQRHTGDHHSFFVEMDMTFEESRDWRVIFFPPWLIVVYSVFVCVPAVLIGSMLINPNAALLFAATLLAGYLMYEFFHACQHLPRSHWLIRLPWLRETARLHRLHHRRDLMRRFNFNLVFPLTDWLVGSLYWEPVDPPEAPVAGGNDTTPETRTR